MFLLEVTQAFEQNNLPYALVGGYAVALHGAVRGTIDVDLIISLDEASLYKAEQLLLNMGLKPRLPVHAKDIYQHRELYIQEKNLIAWSFFNPDNLLECVDIIITHNLQKTKFEIKSIAGKNIHVIALKELIKMKKLAGRPQDLADVRALEDLHEC